MVKAIVNACPNVTYFYVSPSMISKSLFGQSEEEVKKIFKEFRKSSPSVLFMDDLDGMSS